MKGTSKIQSALSLATIFLLLATINVRAEVSALDATGKRVSLKSTAQRIISLSPHGTEMLFAAGAGEYVLGVGSFSDYPEAAKKIQQVGSYDRLDMEAIIALSPDLIVAWKSGSPGQQVERLERLGFTIFYSNPIELDDIANEVESLAVLAGTSTRITNVMRYWRDELVKLKMRYSGKDKVRAFYQIWHQPLMTVNGKHLISKVMELCGAENVFAGLPSLVPRLDIEAVLAANPELIVASGSVDGRPEWLDGWKQWPQLLAVQKNNISHSPPDVMQRAGPRILEGARHMCELVEQARNRRVDKN
ncbi:MAG: cobalamin-binding protein [Gammaproteobacteria bacterium]|nr:cobalamin-binding protein [Gammaproteobacteria bacterium]